jgi:hypothetical protein
VCEPEDFGTIYDEPQEPFTRPEGARVVWDDDAPDGWFYE